MLSSNSTLQNGRYRIIGLFGDTAEGRMYDAYDDQLGQKVIMHESPGSGDFTTKLAMLKSRRLDGVVRVRDGFTEAGKDYLVTEAVESRASRPEFANNPSLSVTRMLKAIQSLLNEGVVASRIEIAPLGIRLASDGHNSLVHFGCPQSDSSSIRPDNKLTPYGALESIWSGLDLVTQKAIANSYDEASLDVLESPADERTCIYSLGASIYSIVSGRTPPDALVRMIEVLDGNPDPLKSAADVRSDVSNELSAVLEKMLKLRREDRFQSLDEVNSAVASIVPVSVKASVSEPDDEIDELDLLEIPEILTPAAKASATQIEPVFPAAMMEKAAKTDAEPVVRLPRPQEPAIASAAESLENWLVEKESPASSSETMPVSKPAVATPTPMAFSFEESDDAKPSSAKKFMVAGAAAAVLIAGGIWGMMSLGTTTATQVSAQSESTAPAAKPAEAEPKAFVEVQPTPASVSTDAPQPTAPDVRLDQQKNLKRPVVAEVKPEKPAQPKPEKPKRSVTVEDLISDN